MKASIETPQNSETEERAVKADLTITRRRTALRRWSRRDRRPCSRPATSSAGENPAPRSRKVVSDPANASPELVEHEQHQDPASLGPGEIFAQGLDHRLAQGPAPPAPPRAVRAPRPTRRLLRPAISAAMRKVGVAPPRAGIQPALRPRTSASAPGCEASPGDNPHNRGRAG